MKDSRALERPGTFICVKRNSGCAKKTPLARRERSPRDGGIDRAEKRKEHGKAVGETRETRTPRTQFFASVNELVVQVTSRKRMPPREIIDYLTESRFRDREPYVKRRELSIFVRAF